jgi:hypothetical protein
MVSGAARRAGRRGIVEMSRPITRADVPGLGLQIYYRTRLTVQARRMDGEFTVETPHGPQKCADGYLAVDLAGDVYPIPVGMFEQTYSVDVMAVMAQLPSETLALELSRRQREEQPTDVYGGVVEDLNQF